MSPIITNFTVLIYLNNLQNIFTNPQPHIMPEAFIQLNSSVSSIQMMLSIFDPTTFIQMNSSSSIFQTIFSVKPLNFNLSDLLVYADLDPPKVISVNKYSASSGLEYNLAGNDACMASSLGKYLNASIQLISLKLLSTEDLIFQRKLFTVSLSQIEKEYLVKKLQPVNFAWVPSGVYNILSIVIF